MTEQRQKLIDRFQKWLDTNPNKRIVASQCANIAEDYAKEQFSLPTQEEIHIEADKHQDMHTDDPLALTYDAFVAGCNYVINKK